ncbi:MAG TPA: LysR substrate-binding domain-containing protein [Burkholderiales bacterium]|jgi:DNA-binding transcriptional LysR family regulator|nr:LysR substrate-binding domain-containing protein [Burkholderiales bacterium]
MDLVELHIFKTVAEQGGITKAAAALHRVQSNVTTRVKQLEDRVGAKLFHRQGRRLVLSSEGKVLLAYADRMLRLSDEAQAALKGHGPHGVFKLGTLESTAATRLPPVLARYHRGYPAVRLELITGTSGALVDRVLRGEIEAAFVAEPFAEKSLETQHVFTEELVLITPKGHRRVTRPQDVDERIVLGFTTGCSYRRRLESWLGRSSIVAERVMEYGSYHAITACVAAGAGIAVVPKSVLRTTGVEGQVAVHALPASIAHAKTMLVWRSGYRSAPLDALRQELR